MLFVYIMRWYLLLFFCFFLCGFTCRKDTALSREWLALIHQTDGLFYQKTGTIGSDSFYLSPFGRHDPRAELEATIDLFNKKDVTKQCLFPARYLFLKKLGFVQTPFPKCPEYEQFKKDLHASGVTLLFTDAYMNNSSSLFGHTLIRIDTSRQGTQLLAHGVNYGAYTRGFEDSPFYALYGLLGFFQGGLTTKPYYDIINTYNNIENRDIWEYNLDLDQNEVDFFVAHIWEIGQTTTPYYFFSRNCSYMLLEMLDALRPDLELAKNFRFYTIPLDTIKAVNKKGIVKTTRYRPSRANKIKYRLAQMNKKQYHAFLSLILKNENTVDNLPKQDRGDVLETAYQYVQYQYVKKSLDLKEYRKKSFMLLRLRNQNKAGQKFDDLKDGTDPVLAHNSGQIGISFGTEGGKFFEELHFRPAYHSLTDRQDGYLKGAAINFLQTRIRHENKKDRYVLQNLKILELVSLSPIDRIFVAPSYKLNLDIVRKTNLYTKAQGHIAKADLKIGGTYAVGENLWLYALIGPTAEYGGFIKGNTALAASGEIGTLLYFNKWAIEAKLQKTFAKNNITDVFAQKLCVNYAFSQNFAFEIFGKRQSTHKNHLSETGATFKYFF